MSDIDNKLPLELEESDEESQQALIEKAPSYEESPSYEEATLQEAPTEQLDYEAQDAKPKKKSRKALWIVIGIFLLCAVVALSIALGIEVSQKNAMRHGGHRGHGGHHGKHGRPHGRHGWPWGKWRGGKDCDEKKKAVPQVQVAPAPQV